MLVLKRDGRRESVKFDKITARIEKLCYGLDMNYIEPVEIAKNVINGIYDGVTTSSITWRLRLRQPSLPNTPIMPDWPQEWQSPIFIR